jgi:hypothetical protein
MLALKYLICTLTVTALVQVSFQSKANINKDKSTTVLHAYGASFTQNKDSILSPREGKYLIESFGYNETKPLKIGYFTLIRNEYKYYDLEDNLIDSGTFVYDAPTKQIKWQTGRFKRIGWGGNFSVEHDGKVQTVHLNNTTVAKNIVE